MGIVATAGSLVGPVVFQITGMLVSMKISTAGIGQNPEGDRKLQCCKALAHYFTAGEQSVLLGDSDATCKLHTILERAATLGVRVINEPSYQAITAIYVIALDGPVGISGYIQHAMFL